MLNKAGGWETVACFDLPEYSGVFFDRLTSFFRQRGKYDLVGVIQHVAQDGVGHGAINIHGDPVDLVQVYCFKSTFMGLPAFLQNRSL